MSLLFEYLATLGGAGGSGGTVVVALADQFVADTNSGFAEAVYETTSGGIIRQSTSTNGTETIGAWISPTSAAPGAYEVRADLVTGSVGGSATGVWLALSTTRGWSLQLVGSGIETATLTVSIRLSGVTLASCTVTLVTEAL